MKARIHKALEGRKNTGGGDNPRNGMTLQTKPWKGFATELAKVESFILVSF